MDIGPTLDPDISFRCAPRNPRVFLERLGEHGAQPVGHFSIGGRNGPQVKSQPLSRVRNSISSYNTDVLRDISQVLNSLVNQSQSTWMTTFSGVQHECPQKFLTSMEEIFQTKGIPEITTEERSWFQVYESTVLTYMDFKARLLEQFYGAWLGFQLMSKLYGRQQNEDQLVGIFVAEQRPLAQRLITYITEHEIISLIIQGS